MQAATPLSLAGGSLLGARVPPLIPRSHWGCGHSSSRGAHTTPYNQLMHPLVGRYPSRSPTHNRSVGPYMLHPTGSGHALGAGCWRCLMDGEAAASDLGRGCDVPDWVLTAALFPVRGLPLLHYQFLCFFYTAIQTNSFFVSKLSLSFPG